MSYKTLKEVCTLTGCTPNALRYYKEKGILVPTKRGESGRREWLYDEAAVTKIKLIALFRKLGASVAEIEMILEELENHRLDTLEKKLSEMREERNRLDRKISAAEALVIIKKISTDSDDEERMMDELLRVSDL